MSHFPSNFLTTNRSLCRSSFHNSVKVTYPRKFPATINPDLVHGHVLFQYFNLDFLCLSRVRVYVVQLCFNRSHPVPFFLFQPNSPRRPNVHPLFHVATWSHDLTSTGRSVAAAGIKERYYVWPHHLTDSYSGIVHKSCSSTRLLTM